MKLSQYCKKMGISYRTGFYWYKKGLIEGAYKTPSGSIFVEEPEKGKGPEKAVIYCRVSSYKQKEDLERQVERCRDFCAAQGIQVAKTYKEVASGMNDNRQQFWKMIKDKPTRIIVENKDRLTRFGFNYIERLGDFEIVVVNDDNNEADLMKDLISVITSFCCRLYGMRRGYGRAKRIKEQIMKEEE